MTPALKSAIYEGWVRHRRFEPVENNFRYRVAFAYVDLDELEEIHRTQAFWSTKGPNLSWFRRGDHMGDPNRPLAEEIRKLIADRGLEVPSGPIRLLTQFRNFGFLMNPVSFYYCFDENERLACVVAEVTNTPWGEMHCYVLDEGHWGESRNELKKDFHVSPFMPMDMVYQWRMGPPDEKVRIHIDQSQLAKRKFDVTMELSRKAWTAATLRKSLLAFPFSSFQVFLKIYWQAIKLRWKGLKFYPHPKHKSAESKDRSVSNETLVQPTISQVSQKS